MEGFQRYVAQRRKVEKARWVVLTSDAGVRALPGIVGDVMNVAGAKIAVVGSIHG